jgi:hypothetical protein
MPKALGLALGMLIVGPLIGWWRADVWLKKNKPANTERTVRDHHGRF